MVHRDLKPANVMLDGDGNVRITDFGLAVTAGDAAAMRAGTPQYMAPEQLRGEPASIKTDIYALGLVLFEIFTGKRAYDAKTLHELRQLEFVIRMIRIVEFLRIASTSLRPVRRRGVPWVVWPRMLRISSAELFPHLRIRSIPEAAQIARQLNRLAIGRKERKQNGLAPRSNAGRLRQTEQLLQLD